MDSGAWGVIGFCVAGVLGAGMIVWALCALSSQISRLEEEEAEFEKEGIKG